MDLRNVLILLLPILVLWILTVNEVNASRKRRTPSEESSTGQANSSSSATAKSSASESEKRNSSSNSGTQDSNGFKLICLISNKEFYRTGFTPDDIDEHICPCMHYEFAHLDGTKYEIKPGDPKLDIDLEFYKLIVAKKKKNNGKVVLSLGGWEDSSKKYSDMIASKARIVKFCAHAVEFLKKHGFDGLDVSWQYPNCWQGACGCAPQDQKNFVTWITECCKVLHENSLTCSISVASIKREIEAAYADFISTLAKIVDYIIVMAYDLHGPWERITGHHAQFQAMPDDEDKSMNAMGALKTWTDKGAPKYKLILGIPLYAKTFTLKTAGECHLGAQSIGVGKPGPITMTGGMLSYAEICQYINSGNWTLKKDKYAGYYMCGDHDQLVCYDTPSQVVTKTYSIATEGYGGVALKNVGLDDFEGKCFGPHFKCPLTKLAHHTGYHMCQKKQQAQQNW